jgi:osmotically inducible protein OsmC
MKILYSAVASATAGREGRVVTRDTPAFDLPLSLPTGMGGPGGDGTNPEQLFAAGYAACFGSACKLVAARQKLPVGSFEITAHVDIGRGEGGLGLAAVLHGKFPEITKEQAEALMHAAHQVCPYSKATRGNVEVQLLVD